jgi:segregation and condensation protein B
MSLKNKVEAIIYAAEEPVTVDQIAGVLREVMPPEPAADDAPADAAEATPKTSPKSADAKAEFKARVRATIEELIAEYDTADRGMEIRAVAGGYRMSTRPEHHDAVRVFAKALKAPVRLSLQALETLAVIAYKQPVTVPEISEIRGVDSSGVIGTLLDRKLITTAGRKQVVGRPILYKTTKEFLLRFGLKDVNELPSMEEFEKLAGDTEQADLFQGAVPDATGVPDEAASSETAEDASETISETGS